MGSGIGASLLRHGFPLTVLEHPGNQPLDKLLAAGATTRPRAAQLAGEADILILCVTGSPQVEAVLFQQDGVLQGLRRGTIVIDCSTALDRKSPRLNSSH